jgi:hypothetical protein
MATSEPGNFFQQRGGGFSGDERKDGNFSAGLFHDAAFFLIEGFQGVIAAFYVDVRLGNGKKPAGGFLGKNAHATDAFQSGKHRGAILLVVDGAIRAFQLLDRIVAADANQQQVAQIAGHLEIRDVAKVQDIEATVRDDEALAGGADVGAPGGQPSPGDLLLAKIHLVDIGGTRLELAIPEYLRFTIYNLRALAMDETCKARGLVGETVGAPISFRKNTSAAVRSGLINKGFVIDSGTSF